jgi:membrane-associated phospholipid phosphatase
VGADLSLKPADRELNCGRLVQAEFSDPVKRSGSIARIAKDTVQPGSATSTTVRRAGSRTSTAAGREARPDLHRAPPTTLRNVRRRWPWLVPAAMLLAALLGALASIRRGDLLVWDRPITDAGVTLRGALVDRVALWISRLGSTPVVLAAGVVGVVLAARRCRTLALVMLVTIAARPPVEWLLKDLVARPRPTGARLVAGTGFSYPSGHVLAAAATWGFVPVIAALYIHRRWLWWALSGLAWSTITLVAWSRVWLGVHWTSDVIGGLAIGFLSLSAAEVLIDDQHHRRVTACSSGRLRGPPPRPAVRGAADTAARRPGTAGTTAGRSPQ